MISEGLCDTEDWRKRLMKIMICITEINYIKNNKKSFERQSVCVCVYIYIYIYIYVYTHTYTLHKCNLYI